MIQQTNLCHPAKTAGYLADALTAEEESAFLDHLDGCTACQDHLQSAAGSQEQWREVARAFAPNQFDDFISPDAVGGAETEEATQAAAWARTILSPSDDPVMLGRIGAFEVSGCVGVGGMGVVFKARDPALDRYVAVKALAPHLASSSSARERFAREAKAAAAVVHDNVIAIHQVSQWQGMPYLVMPYLTGPSLQQRLDREGAMEIAEALRVALQVAQGLAAAHAQGLVHRDIKPSNILLCGDTERAILTDFGLARAADDATLTRAGALAGTPQYMSPEQARGETVEASSDLFSLGSVFFAMLTGAPPVSDEGGLETIQQIAASPPPRLRELRPDLPAWLERLVSLLHAFDAQDRIASAEEAARLISAALAHVQQPETNALPQRLTSAQENRRSPGKIVATLGAVVAVMALALFLLIGGSDGRTIEAKSASQADVQAAVDEATDGDTVIVPAGVATWTRPVRIENKSITLQGAGHAKTKVHGETEGPHAVLLMVKANNDSPLRITGFSFEPEDVQKDSNQGLISIRGTCRRWRIDHCRFENLRGIGIEVWNSDDTYGLIDHCEFTTRPSRAALGVVVRGSGDMSWQQPLALGTDKAVYVEDCKFDWKTQRSGALAAADGARYVFRHNEVSGTWVAHGGITAHYRAAFSGEIYGNTFHDGRVNAWTAVEFLGGTGVIFNNAISRKIDSVCVMQNIRSVEEGAHRFGKRGIADGSNPLDGNEKPNGYPCCDQVGRSTDTGLGTAQKHQPLYFWENERLDETPAPVRVQHGKQHIHAECDYYVTPSAKPDYEPFTYPHPLTQK